MPGVKNLDEGFWMSAIPGHDGTAYSRHKGLPQQTVERIHVLKIKSVKCHETIYIRIENIDPPIRKKVKLRKYSTG